MAAVRREVVLEKGSLWKECAVVVWPWKKRGNTENMKALLEDTLKALKNNKGQFGREELKKRVVWKIGKRRHPKINNFEKLKRVHPKSYEGQFLSKSKNYETSNS